MKSLGARDNARWKLRPVLHAKILRNMPAVVKLVNESSTNDRDVRRVSVK